MWKIVYNVIIVLGDDGADDFGDGEDFEGFAQYGDGQEFDESIAGASGSGGGDGKGREQLLILYQEQSGLFSFLFHITFVQAWSLCTKMTFCLWTLTWFS